MRREKPGPDSTLRQTRFQVVEGRRRGRVSRKCVVGHHDDVCHQETKGQENGDATENNELIMCGVRRLVGLNIDTKDYCDLSIRLL